MRGGGDCERNVEDRGVTQGVGGKVSHPGHGSLCGDSRAEARVGPERDHRPGQVGLHPRTQNLESSLPRRGLPFQEPPTFPSQPTHNTEVFLASLCPAEQDVRAARRSMVPFIWARGQTCGAGVGQRETETVRERERQGQRETETHRERQNQGETYTRTGAHTHSREIRNREALRTQRKSQVGNQGGTEKWRRRFTERERQPNF